MSRGTAKTKKNKIVPEDKFQSIILTKFINYVMKNGKKTVAKRIVYTALDKASKETKLEQMDLFNQVLKNVGPILEVKSKRIGGANYQVPMEVTKDRKNTLAMRWIISSASQSKGKPMADKLADELILAFKGEGNAIKKKQDTHKMAEANKAFAHFARF